MNGFGILAGIGLILFGVRFLRKGLDRLFGGKLLLWLSLAVTSPWKAFIGGICAGVVAPSSTGLALLTAHMTSVAKLSTGLMLAVLLGANVGLTVAVQLVAFHLHDYAGLFVICGIVAFLFLKRELFRGIGQSILALGFVFLAIHLISKDASTFSDSADLREFLLLLQGHPWLVLLVVSILTIFLQSSTATIGVGLGLAASGLFDVALMVPWVLGASLGLAITSLLAGWSSLEGRRLGTAHMITKAICAFACMIFFTSAMSAFAIWPSSLERQAAMFYTEFNLLAGLAAMPLLGVIERIVRFLIPDQSPNGLAIETSFLDESVLESPPFALARATRETLRMIDHVRLMFKNFWEAFSRQDVDLARRLQREDDTVDHINLELASYLGRITEEKSSTDSHWQLALLGFANEIESAGDLIDKHLCDLLIKQRAEGVILRESDRQALQNIYTQIIERFELASDLLASRNSEKAAAFLAGKDSFNEGARNAQRVHYEQLHLASRSDIATSAFFLDYLNAFRRINSHLSSLGYSLHRLERTAYDSPTTHGKASSDRLSSSPA